MGTKTKYYIVAAEALPEIFIKVAEAKRMMQTGEAGTVGAATRQVGISRSAFYKYKDAVQPFNNMKTGHIITFYIMLKDNPGVHPHQRLRGGDHLRRDQRHGIDAGGSDLPGLRPGGRGEIRNPGGLTAPGKCAQEKESDNG